MKLIFLFVVFSGLFIKSFSISLSNDQLKTLSLAAVEAIKILYSGKFQIDFFIYGQNSDCNWLLSHILSNINENFQFTVKNFENISSENSEFDDSAIILLKNTQDFNKFNKLAKLSHVKPTNNKFLIICVDFDRNEFEFDVATSNEPFEEISMEIPPFVDNIQLHSYILEVNDTNIDLISLRLFSEKSCNEQKLIKIDSFNLTSKLWQNSLKNHENFENFHGCILPFVPEYFYGIFYFKNFIDRPRSSFNMKSLILSFFEELLKRLHEFEDIEYDGILYELIERMGKIANFTPLYQSKTFLRQDIVRRNFYSDKAFMFKPSFQMDSSRLLHTKALIAETLVSYLSQTELYSNYEKCFLPFDQTTWIVLSLTFVIAFLVIFIVNKLPKSVQEIVYGVNVKTPIYNVFGIFFGISQNPLPEKTFARFILMCFILFCLVFRTCYQSKMFEFISTDMRKPPPGTIDEIIERNYSIYAMERSNFDIFHPEYRDDKNIIINQNSFEKIYSIICGNNPETKQYFITPNFYLEIIESHCNKKFKIFARNEQLIAFSMSNVIMFNLLSKAIDEFSQTGIIKYQVDRGIYFSNPHFQPDVEDTKRIFSLEDLEYGFVMYLGAIAVCIICFVFEHLLNIIRRWKINFIKTVIGNFVFLTILRQKMNVYHN